MADGERTRARRFHGQVASEATCSQPGCDAPGEFRAPASDGRRASFDGPGEWRWLCLDHVRAFNASYNYFSGMSTDEIEAAQRPFAGWERETRAFSTGGDRPPRWADFADPLEAIAGRFGQRRESETRSDGKPLSEGDRKALRVLGLATDADRRALRLRYAELVRRYHPDRNGGDRSHEAALIEVIAAYDRLRRAPAFA